MSFVLSLGAAAASFPVFYLFTVVMMVKCGYFCAEHFGKALLLPPFVAGIGSTLVGEFIGK